MGSQRAAMTALCDTYEGTVEISELQNWTSEQNFNLDFRTFFKKAGNTFTLHHEELVTLKGSLSQ